MFSRRLRSFQVLWVSVSQRAAKLKAVKVGKLKKNSSARHLFSLSPGWWDHPQYLMDPNFVALWPTETYFSIFLKSASNLPWKFYHFLKTFDLEYLSPLQELSCTGNSFWEAMILVVHIHFLPTFQTISKMGMSKNVFFFFYFHHFTKIYFYMTYSKKRSRKFAKLL